MAEHVVNYNGNKYVLEHATRGGSSFWFWEGIIKHILFEAKHTKNSGAVYKVTNVEWRGGINLGESPLKTGDVINLGNDVTINLTRT